MKKTFLFFALLFLISMTTYSQSWQWAGRGGSPVDWPGNGGDIERVREMVTDRKGNTYVIGQTNKYQVDVDGHSLGTIFGDGSMVVASFDCNGAFRWAKPIGTYGSAFLLKSIGVDTLGGVYIFSEFTSDPFGNNSLFQIGSDTTFGTTAKSLVLLKLDTAGAYKWARLPQADTVVSYSYWTRAIDMSVEQNGTVHLFTMLPPGAYANGQAVVSSQDLYILKYNAQGQFTTKIKPQLSSIGSFGGWFTRMVYDARNSRYYFNGSEDSANKVSFNGVPNKDAFYIAAYSSLGSLLWIKQGVSPYTHLSGRTELDSAGNIYLGGDMYSSDTFQGHVFVNQVLQQFPFAMKLNASGNLQWAKSGQTTCAIGSTAIKYANGVVALGGTYSCPVAFDSFKVTMLGNTGSDIYLARINAANGAVLSMDSAKSPVGYNDGVSHISSDGKGNFYVGGSLAQQLSFGPHSITNIGGASDWFVAKFGRANCNCVTAPVASFTYTAPATNRTATFTYSGTTTDLDSLVWTFGNGQKRVVTSGFNTAFQHTYGGMGTYNVCVKAYGACGTHQSCKTVGVAMGVEYISSEEVNVLSLSPNPATEVVTIGYSTSVSGNLEVYDVLGRKVASAQTAVGSGSWKLDVSGYTPGIYRVVLREDGKVVRYQSLAVQR